MNMQRDRRVTAALTERDFRSIIINNMDRMTKAAGADKYSNK